MHASAIVGSTAKVLATGANAATQVECAVSVQPNHEAAAWLVRGDVGRWFGLGCRGWVLNGGGMDRRKESRGDGMVQEQRAVSVSGASSVSNSAVVSSAEE